MTRTQPAQNSEHPEHLAWRPECCPLWFRVNRKAESFIHSFSFIHQDTHSDVWEWDLSGLASRCEWIINDRSEWSALELLDFGLSYPGNGEGHVEILASLQAEAPRPRSSKCHSVSAHGWKRQLYYLVCMSSSK